MTLSDLERLSKSVDDTERRAAFLQQLSCLCAIVLSLVFMFIFGFFSVIRVSLALAYSQS